MSYHTPHIGQRSMSMLLKRCCALWAGHTCRLLWFEQAVGVKCVLGGSREYNLISSCALGGTQNSFVFNTTRVCRRQPSSAIVWKCILLRCVAPCSCLYVIPPAKPHPLHDYGDACHDYTPPRPPSASQPEPNPALADYRGQRNRFFLAITKLSPCCQRPASVTASVVEP